MVDKNIYLNPLTQRDTLDKDKAYYLVTFDAAKKPSVVGYARGSYLLSLDEERRSLFAELAVRVAETYDDFSLFDLIEDAA